MLLLKWNDFRQRLCSLTTKSVLWLKCVESIQYCYLGPHTTIKYNIDFESKAFCVSRAIESSLSTNLNKKFARVCQPRKPIFVVCKFCFTLQQVWWLRIFNRRTFSTLISKVSLQNRSIYSYYKCKRLLGSRVLQLFYLWYWDNHSIWYLIQSLKV